MHFPDWWCPHLYVYLDSLLTFCPCPRSGGGSGNVHSSLGGHPHFPSSAGALFLNFSFLPESESQSVMSDSLQPHGLYSPWNSPGQNTGVGSLSLLQGIYLTPGSNPGLPHYRQILYQLSHLGSPSCLREGTISTLSSPSWAWKADREN